MVNSIYFTNLFKKSSN